MCHRIIIMKNLKIGGLFFTGILLIGIPFIAVAQGGQVSIEQDERIPELLALKTEMANKNVIGDRYKIQLFSGVNQEASEVIKEYRELFEKWPSTIVYETPNYKVWIGNFRNSLEADRALLAIKKEFPTAFRFRPERN